MKGNRAAIVAVVVIVLLAGAWLFLRRTGGATAVELVPIFDSAEKRPADGTFEVIDAELDGETKRAIYTVPNSRIIYKVRVPDDAWLKVAVGTKPESWTEEGDGVLFRVGVSDGRTYDPLFTQHVNPFAQQRRPQVDPGVGGPRGLRRRGRRADLQHQQQPARQGGRSAQRPRALGRAGDRRRDEHRRRGPAARPRRAVRAAARGDPGGGHPRLRQPALHPRAGGRGARTGARTRARRHARRDDVVGDRRDPGDPDGARHRPGRRGDHADLLVLRHRRVRRARRGDAGARGRRSRVVQRRSVRRPGGPHAADEGDHARPPVRADGRHDGAAGDRVAPRHPGDRGRVPGDRRPAARPPGRDARYRGLLLVLSEQEPGRVRRRRSRHDERRRARARAAGCSATTAPSRSTSTSGSAATSGSTRCRPPCCA